MTLRRLLAIAFLGVLGVCVLGAFGYVLAISPLARSSVAFGVLGTAALLLWFKAFRWATAQLDRRKKS